MGHEQRPELYAPRRSKSGLKELAIFCLSAPAKMSCSDMQRAVGYSKMIRNGSRRLSHDLISALADVGEAGWKSVLTLCAREPRLESQLVRDYCRSSAKAREEVI